MIHQKKGNIFLCLVIDVILRLDINVKNNMTKTHFFTFKHCIHVANIHGEGTLSQIFSFCPSLYFM